MLSFKDACNIAYPLSSAINNHLREEEAAENLREEVRRYVEIYTSDMQGINTLRDEDCNVEDLIDRVILEIITHPIDSRTIEQVKEFRLQVFKAASCLAGRKIADDIKAAREDAAITAWERRQCEE